MTEFADYAAMRAHLGELHQQGRFEEAVELLESALEQFPDHFLANSYNLAFFCCLAKQYERGIQALQRGLDQGIWYGYYAFYDDLWAPCREFEQFKEIEAQNEAYRREEQAQARPELVVIPPSGYDAGNKSPLFIALHGGGGNMQELEDNWKSEKLEKEFIVALLQSSQVSNPGGFAWMDFELAKKEITEAYQSVVEQYAVDTEQLLMGGFSAGGITTLGIVLDDALPVRGFVVLCPRKPDNFEVEHVRDAKQRGVRGVILTTEMDPELPSQEEMVAAFEKEGLPCRFVVTPNIGHWFPQDFSAQIDQAIDYINKKPGL
jgi:predicted esterase